MPSIWPKSLWRFPLPDDVILSHEGDVPAIITLDELKEELLITVHQGKSEYLPVLFLYPFVAAGSEEDAVCWVGGCGPAFASSLTDATTSVLTAELDSCKELLQMEPDNKCERPNPILLDLGTRLLFIFYQGVFLRHCYCCKHWTLGTVTSKY